MKKVLLLIILFVVLGATAQKNKYPYQDAKLTDQERVLDLVPRLSLEEKIRQMDMFIYMLYANKGVTMDSISKKIGSLGVGSIFSRDYLDTPVLSNEMQRRIITQNRWGIPVLFIDEMHHGCNYAGSTIFPSYNVLGSTFDRDLLKAVGRAIATETRAFGVHFGLAPNLDIVTDPRYGRFSETFGEDPYLTAEMGVSLIKGLHGNGFDQPDAIVAEPKHFVGHGAPSGGFHLGPVLIGERELRTKHLYPFERAIKDAGILGVMCAYGEIDGIPCSANMQLLSDILRDELGFEGFVLSDWGSINMQMQHGVAGDIEQACIQGFGAGVDMQLGDLPNKAFLTTMVKLVKEERIPMHIIDKAVTRILNVKFKLGLFENPYIDENRVKEVVYSEKHQELALQAARKGIVLLKNKNNSLPLSSSKAQKIAVIGPMSDTLEFGDYSGKKADDHEYKSLYKAMKELAKNGSMVNHRAGAEIMGKGKIIPTTYLYQSNKIIHGLEGQYFENSNLSGIPKEEKIEELIDFSWEQMGNAVANISISSFSARWSGYIKVDETFKGWIGAVANDGFRLLIDDQVFLEKWGTKTPLTKKNLTLEAGKFYKIKLEYYNNNWSGNIQLRMGTDTYHFKDALALANLSDVVVLALGDDSELVGENKDMATPALPDIQLRLAKALSKTGKPLIIVLQNGRPYPLEELLDYSDALIEAWYAGEKGGIAMAEIILGLTNPSGKLPVSYARGLGQYPMYYNKQPMLKHRYIDEDNTALFPFGFGLSYTTFAYSNLKIKGDRLKLNNDTKVIVSIDVTNTGNVYGEEVVQLYIRDMVSSVTTPVMQLRDFERIGLNKGETKTVTMELSMDDLSLWNVEMKKVTEPGEFKIMVGTNSKEYLEDTFLLVK